jgi:hypothetical protein
MKTRIVPLVLCLVLLLTACNLTSAAGEPSPTQATDTLAGPTIALPSDTPAIASTDTPAIPTDTATITPTETLSIAMVKPTSDAANCRFGPAVTYVSVGGLKVDTSVPVVGQNGDGTWWEIQNPNNPNSTCWVSGAVTTVTGNLGSVPVNPAPVTSVTKVTVTNPPTISVPGCMGPITPMVLTGTIDVNGPTSVTWHFETEQGGALGSHTLVFTKYGPQAVTDNGYTPPVTAGTYWVRLVISAPNSVVTEGSYTIACP